jgi:hypothetical protein
LGVPSVIFAAVRGRSLFVLGLFASFSVTLGVAAAQTDATVRLDYQADARCPTQLMSDGAFVSEVRSRSPRIHFAPDAPRSLVVRIVRERGQGRTKMVGRIELHESDGTTTERAVSGATCEEAVSALGLVAALALDPTASTSDAGAGTTSTASATPSATTTATTSTSTADASSHAHDDDEDASTPLEKRRWSFGAGADGEVVFGASPDPLFAVPVFFEATRALGDVVGLGGGIRFERAGETALTATSGGGADFTWTVGALDLCLALRGSRLRFNTCIRSHIGTIDAHGEGVLPQRSATRPWVDLGLALALRLRIVGPVFIEAAGHVGVALVQDRFFLEPNTTVFQPSGLTAHLGGGLGFEIW